MIRTANFGYEERLLTHMYYGPDNRSGGCDRFYIYGMSSSIMLEVEHGRGVTLYKLR